MLPLLLGICGCGLEEVWSSGQSQATRKGTLGPVKWPWSPFAPPFFIPSILASPMNSSCSAKAYISSCPGRVIGTMGLG